MTCGKGKSMTAKVESSAAKMPPVQAPVAQAPVASNDALTAASVAGSGIEATSVKKSAPAREAAANIDEAPAAAKSETNSTAIDAPSLLATSGLSNYATRQGPAPSASLSGSATGAPPVTKPDGGVAADAPSVLPASKLAQDLIKDLGKGAVVPRHEMAAPMAARPDTTNAAAATKADAPAATDTPPPATASGPTLAAVAAPGNPAPGKAPQAAQPQAPDAGDVTSPTPLAITTGSPPAPPATNAGHVPPIALPVTPPKPDSNLTAKANVEAKSEAAPASAAAKVWAERPGVAAEASATKPSKSADAGPVTSAPAPPRVATNASEHMPTLSSRPAGVQMAVRTVTDFARWAGVSSGLALFALGFTLAGLAGLVTVRSHIFDRSALPVVAADSLRVADIKALFLGLDPGIRSPRGVLADGIDDEAALTLVDQNLHGIDRPVDREEAKYWLRKALARSLLGKRVSWGLTQLGTMYAAPEAGTVDYAKAALLWQLANAAGDPIANCFLDELRANKLIAAPGGSSTAKSDGRPGCEAH